MKGIVRGINHQLASWISSRFSCFFREGVSKTVMKRSGKGSRNHRVKRSKCQNVRISILGLDFV